MPAPKGLRNRRDATLIALPLAPRIAPTDAVRLVTGNVVEHRRVMDLDARDAAGGLPRIAVADFKAEASPRLDGIGMVAGGTRARIRATDHDRLANEPLSSIDPDARNHTLRGVQGGFSGPPAITSQIEAVSGGSGATTTTPGVGVWGGPIKLRDASTLSYTPRTGYIVSSALFKTLGAETLLDISPGGNTEIFFLAFVDAINGVGNAPLAPASSPS